MTADPELLQGKQMEEYRIVREHLESGTPLRMIVSGTAGTGKSYLIKCLQQLLGDRLRVSVPTGVAAYNVHSHTLHSLPSIPVRGGFKDLEGQRLHTIQESLAGVDYLVTDERSMMGRKLFGQVDRRLHQAYPHRSACLNYVHMSMLNCISIVNVKISEAAWRVLLSAVIGDWGQLPPVMDLPLYTTVSRSELSDLGSANYHLFDHAVVMEQVM